MTFMYRALTILRRHLESSTLTQAWSSINHHFFLVVIIQKAQEIWINLLHWEKCATHIPLFDNQSQKHLKLTGEASFHNYHATGSSIEFTLSAWIFSVDQWFPGGVMTLINAFCDIVPHNCLHIFATITTQEIYYPPYLDHRKSHLPGTSNGGQATS